MPRSFSISLIVICQNTQFLNRSISACGRFARTLVVLHWHSAISAANVLVFNLHNTHSFIAKWLLCLHYVSRLRVTKFLDKIWCNNIAGFTWSSWHKAKKCDEKGQHINKHTLPGSEWARQKQWTHSSMYMTIQGHAPLSRILYLLLVYDQTSYIIYTDF